MAVKTKNRQTKINDKKSKSERGALVGIVMGSDSDWPVLSAAHSVLNDFGVANEVRVISAHRTPDDMLAYAEAAAGRGLKVLITAAGGAAHLPGMMASATTLPVIGVPINITKLEGVDAFLSIVQMPRGVPVAAVGVDNAANAALLAIRMLATFDTELGDRLLAKLIEFKKSSRAKVAKADSRLRKATRQGKKA